MSRNDSGGREPAEVKAARADALMELDRYDQAIKLWREVIASDPSQARPFFGCSWF